MKLLNKISALSNRQIAVALIAIVLVFFLWKFYLKPNLQGLKRKLTPAVNTDGTKGENISDERKVFLNDLAKNLRTAIYSYGATFDSSRESLMGRLMAINDKELIYTNAHYKTLGTNTMFYDIENEWMPFTEVDDNLLNRLRELNIDQK